MLSLLKIELSIIIVNWNGGELLGRCVESVVAAPPSVEYEIVVVDNASADQSVEAMRAGRGASELEARGRLRVFLNEDNKGFGQANNQAFELTDAPLLFLLNPDTEVTPGALDRLLKTLGEDARHGAVGPRLVNTDGSLQASVWRNPPTALSILLSASGGWRLLPKRVRGEFLLGHYWEHDRRRRVEMLGGAAILVRREVIDEVGGFDARFHMYGEDNEWCLRMVRAGWRLMFEPSAIVLHHGGRSSAKRWDTTEKLRVQLEAAYFFQRHSLPKRRLVANLLAGYLASSFQRACRRVAGRRLEEVEVSAEVQRRQLKEALRRG